MEITESHSKLFKNGVTNLYLFVKQKWYTKCNLFSDPLEPCCTLSWSAMKNNGVL